jgi:hypothetical protein
MSRRERWKWWRRDILAGIGVGLAAVLISSAAGRLTADPAIGLITFPLALAGGVLVVALLHSRAGWLGRVTARLDADALLRESLLVFLATLAAVGLAAQQSLLDGRRADRQEVLTNTQFIRSVALDPAARAQPFARLNLKDAQLSDLNLSCRDPDEGSTCANLAGANLTGASLDSAILTSASLRFSNLAAANLSYADLTGADLTRADLTGADLSVTDLTGANLRGADLAGANLTFVRLRRTCFDSSTSWPGPPPREKPDCKVWDTLPGPVPEPRPTG